ncbi:putative leucine-rich repeat-containing protein DDB_G0290503 [Clytia hemisphaerica]|uniref:putative leucine-rich repeat-containing protein DDB_G0290503 n=1 Tax=Clytia hemisphaerica TaxID=252671 RepID=UPI0034D56DB6
MDSANFDDRNLAHSAAGRNVTNKVANSVVEIAKLKEDHDKQIQKLTFENKIKFLESENNHQMKIMQLEKNNQSLTHELELLKLKTSHEQEAKKDVVDREMEREMLKQQNEFQNKLTEKDKELAGKDKEMIVKESEFKLKMKELEIVHANQLTAKQNECELKLIQKVQEMIAKESEFKLKLAEVENANKLKIAEHENVNKLKLLEKEKGMADKVNELNLKINELETLHNKTKMEDVASGVNIIQKKQDGAEARDITRTEKLTWGADKFFESKPGELNLFASYQDWYEEISSLLHDGEEEIVWSGASKYVFMKRDCGRRFETLLLIAHRKERPRINYSHLFYIEGVEKQFWEKTAFMLLHPSQHNKNLKMVENLTRKQHEQWKVSYVSNDFYHGREKSAILFGIFDRNDD